MSFFASVNGLQVVGGSLLIPVQGVWTADLQLATAEPLSGAVNVVLGNLALRGAVYRSDSFGGQTLARLVGGYAGWRTVVSQQGYGSSGGVKLSHVLGDVANACGEKINVSQDRTIGPAYARADGPASNVLWQLVAMGIIPAWRVDTAGVTQITPWPTQAVSSPFTVTDQRPDEGLVVIATEDYASWLPGCTFTAPQLQGSFANAGVNYVFDNDGLARLEVLTGTGATDRFLGALSAFVARQLAPTRFYGRYRYTISNPTTTTVDGAPVDDSIGLPELTGVPINADSISSYVPPSGGECHIMFLDGVPTAPRCVWTSSPPTHADLLDGTTPAAKLGDTVQSMVVASPPNLTGTLMLSDGGTTPAPMMTLTPYAIVPLASSLLILSPVSGTIVTGSAGVSLPL